MEMALWIIFCFFASIGLVQCIFWLAETFRHPGEFKCGYYLMPLYDEPEQLEARLRCALSGLRSDSRGCDQVILVDMGLGEECINICEKLTLGIGGVYICDPHEITDILTGTDD